VISVTDTGTGIDPSVRETLFDPFVTTKEPGKGTGLGLATVASIVDAMGGSISVYSAVEKGTTFEVALPFHDAGTPATTVAASTEPVDGRGHHVLVVEDEAAVRSALTKVLRHHHFDVVEAASAPDALHVLDARPVDILVSDVVMPTMSGVQLAAHVRADHPDLPIVLMSGYSDELGGIGDDAHRTALLRKPFTHGELLAAVDALLADRPADPVHRP
jgi:CheY-like chemotaxis protein